MENGVERRFLKIVNKTETFVELYIDDKEILFVLIIH